MFSTFIEACLGWATQFFNIVFDYHQHLAIETFASPLSAMLMVHDIIMGYWIFGASKIMETIKHMESRQVQLLDIYLRITPYLNKSYIVD